MEFNGNSVFNMKSVVVVFILVTLSYVKLAEAVSTFIIFRVKSLRIATVYSIK